MPTFFLHQFPKRKSCLGKGCTRGHWSIDSETSDTGCSNGSLEQLYRWQWVTAGKKQSRCVPHCVLLFLLQHWSRNLINIQLPTLIKAENFVHMEEFHATAAQGAWAHVMITQMLCCLCNERQSISWLVSHNSGNVGCQRTVNSIQFKLLFNAL